ncbi:unnamed protein product [Caenorhabditis auriculariae]|uniref:Uncharacterized protein n=1 Tax=Caenorhabditis auriculariae TaxID=2777116 RepID=A0A8S1HAE5_9PELO|nr:unnamed protein product [Caenorhabditis auriculariae]
MFSSRVMIIAVVAALLALGQAQVVVPAAYEAVVPAVSPFYAAYSPYYAAAAYPAYYAWGSNKGKSDSAPAPPASSLLNNQRP